MPRPGTPVIPPQWEDRHRPVAEGQMTAECSIDRPGHATTFNETTGRTVYPAPTNLYAGPCRVQASQRLPGQPTVGGRQVTERRYQVAVPATVDGLRINDQVTVTACTGDPDLVGHILRITDVREGSLTWQRDLICQDTTPTTR